MLPLATLYQKGTQIYNWNQIKHDLLKKNNGATENPERIEVKERAYKKRRTKGDDEPAKGCHCKDGAFTPEQWKLNFFFSYILK